MGRTALNITILFFVLILAQVVICNNICLFNVAVPFVFIYFIVRLPLTMNINIVLTISFLCGLTIDMFSDTQGMHALSCTILAFIRKYILRLYIPREEEISDGEVSIKSVGFMQYFKYLLTIVLTYCIIIFTIEALSFFNIMRLLSQIFFSTILSFVIILGIDRITNKQREKKL